MANSDSTRHAHNFKDLTGQRFGKWTVTSRANVHRKSAYWNCVCDCGNHSVVYGSDLRTGRSTRCVACGNASHGMSKTPEYKIWLGIRTRCECPTATGYQWYGAIGRTVSDEWKSFETFYHDMGQRPSPRHSIERVNNSLGYSKSNCIWATRPEQMRNMGRNHMITFEGRTQCLQAWADELGINKSTLRKRLKRGWSLERAFTKSVQVRR